MNQDIKDLVEISKFAARYPELVQGGGGNTSVKSADQKTLYIKASGFRLSDVTESSGFLSMNLSRVREIATDRSYKALSHVEQQERSLIELQEAVLIDSSLRPSLETEFHSLLDRCVVHTHPQQLNIINCLRAGCEELLALINKNIAATISVPYAPPGHPLAVLIYECLETFKLKNGKYPPIILLENHGLISHAGSPADAMDLTDRCLKLCREYFGTLHIPKKKEIEASQVAKVEQLTAALKQLGFACLTLNADLFAYSSELFKSDEIIPLIPDDAVYWGYHPLAIADEDEISAASVKKAFLLPDTNHGVFQINKVGFLVFAKSQAMLQSIKESFEAHLMLRLTARDYLAKNRASLRALSNEDISYLLNMDAEKYRQAVSANMQRLE